ncbi:hypothetical protein ACTU3I_06565 [Microbacterium sp. RD1]|uniref:hypothetical protein n=1 Tax=Microbacterium sp. RD1 TaxID=3457313 RepID=UPI003FA54C71
MSDANEPERADEGATVEHGEGSGADTVQGGAVGPDAGAGAGTSSTGTQDAPAMDMHDTTDEDRIAGVVAQTRLDVGDASEERILDVLRQRFDDIGLEPGDDRVRALAAEIAHR